MMATAKPGRNLFSYAMPLLRGIGAASVCLSMSWSARQPERGVHPASAIFAAAAALLFNAVKAVRRVSRVSLLPGDLSAGKP